MKRTWQALAGVIALYAVLRGVAELFLIDYGPPSSYREDWGGPRCSEYSRLTPDPGSRWSCGHSYGFAGTGATRDLAP